MDKIIVISSPKKERFEHQKIKSLLELGLEQFHIRKPDFTDFDMISYLQEIPKQYHKCLVLHSHFYLADEFVLKGIQVGVNKQKEAEPYLNKFEYVGYSAHTFQEILDNKEKYTHFFLSPIYDSISKKDYCSNFSEDELIGFLNMHDDINVVALGGIKKNNASQTLDMGFCALAFLGSIWCEDNVEQAFSELKEVEEHRPKVLSIAGFDPSSGAGITSDIKTFEQHQTLGFGVITAITYQNESEFIGADWLSFNQIEKQIRILFSKHQFEFVKIGLIESFERLEEVVELLKKLNPEIKIIWDPILKTSTGFEIHDGTDVFEKYKKVLKSLYLITPNIPECEILFKTDDSRELQSIINENELANILLKGGHAQDNKSVDVLITKTNIVAFERMRIKSKTKHGTGCILSASITANRSKAMLIENAVERAKTYVTKLIDSNTLLLAYHNI